MLLLFWFLLFVVAVCIGLLMPALWGKQIDNPVRDRSKVNGPESSPQSTEANRNGRMFD